MQKGIKKGEKGVCCEVEEMNVKSKERNDGMKEGNTNE